MPPPRLVVMDVDGTLAYQGSLLRHLHGESMAAIDALDEVRDAAELALVSGRSHMTLRGIGDALGIRHMCAELGGLYFTDGERPRPTVPWAGDEPPAAYARRTGLIEGVLDRFPALEDVSPGRSVTVPLKGPLPERGPEDVRRLVESLDPAFTALDNGEHKDLGKRILHVTPRGVGKVAGIRHLQSVLGVGHEDTIMIGDSPQDAACHVVVRAVHMVANGDTAGLANDKIRWASVDHGLGVAEALGVEFGLNGHRRH